MWGSTTHGFLIGIKVLLASVDITHHDPNPYSPFAFWNCSVVGSSMEKNGFLDTSALW
jgi:hypothetical protein